MESSVKDEVTLSLDAEVPDPTLRITEPKNVSESSEDATVKRPVAATLENAIDVVTPTTSATGCDLNPPAASTLENVIDAVAPSTLTTACDSNAPVAPKLENVINVHVVASASTIGYDPSPSVSATPENVVGVVTPSVSTAKHDSNFTVSEAKVETKPPPDPPALVVVKPFITPHRASLTQHGSMDRQLTGMKPIVPLRKRGQSFRETKNMVTMVDADGRRHLNQYTFLEQLGKGAYGIVFKVETTDTKEVFAAKCVDKKALKRIRVGRFGNALQSVKKELTIWKRFKHRHIVVLREVIDTDDSDELYMISELVDGGPVLDDDIKCTPLNTELTKTYFTHLIEGIDFLHENKVSECLVPDDAISLILQWIIIHRDIKPGNLLLKTVDENEKILKIADFGVSHEMENDNDSMRQTAGTAIFMAPEMLTGESFQGKPIDIWACGVTLYMFVYGRPPFIAETMTVLYGKIQNDLIEYPAQVGDRVVEEELIDLLKHILDKNPRQRFTSQQIRVRSASCAISFPLKPTNMLQAHPWAWREFQVSAVKCVTHPDGRRTSFSAIPKSLANVASIGKSMRGIFARPSAVFPGASTRSSLPTVMTNFRAPQ
ncbi:Calcium/calmodulin-dependent protein kinase kinase 2 [Phytophthora citrophthora]|uniref:Calcium/calmodulin-dependent protein kinase kinase 2 n=1 Tax=Phytophthora citrophthora TaxID=4793 RepID=A0AAD9LIK1_9STRA|nr:Calcium/calmodulin-dependent protein kinase kinase 2 [Phytophthora citrophthora]